MAPLSKTAALSLLLALAEARRPGHHRHQQSSSKSAATTAAAADCDCYKASASSTAFYSNRHFFDFRNIANPSVPAVNTDQATDANAGPTNAYFESSEWNDVWSTQSWDSPAGGDSTVTRQNSLNNVYISPSDGSQGTTGSSYLTLRSARSTGAYQSISEVESRDTNYQFLTMRMLARTTGAPGSCTALFTYNGQVSPVQEADIEILTRQDDNIINYTNQPGKTQGATTAPVLPGGARWTDWLELRYDWTPGSSDWYVNGELAASIQVQTPQLGLSVIMNNWSSGGVWTGVMDVGGEALMDIQWLDVSYNTTAQDGGACNNVCVIDDLV